jgi:hypothetical protein
MLDRLGFMQFILFSRIMAKYWNFSRNRDKGDINYGSGVQTLRLYDVNVGDWID